ncbi:unnamed protein product [Litomosoides sigmodontis]|uniref:Uncharacterized protein n=1 Tax=Litomosoides sigmodontis TaxID=42156 RepID=A0A3P6TXZ3_LITSI|nr:unnamed protein product [Litomosoides sigmodontis]
MGESKNNKVGETFDEVEFDNDSLETLLREHGLLPSVDDVPAVGSEKAVEEEEGRTRFIDTFRAAQALKALRIVSKDESSYFKFVLPEEISPDEASDDNEGPCTSSLQTPAALPVEKEESGVREASMREHTVSEGPKEAEELSSTSPGCTSSADQSGEILSLCGPFESVDYTDAMWYYNLKKIIFLRARELEKENKNAAARGDELRKRNEELRNLHGSLVSQSATSAPQYSLEEVAHSSSVEDLSPQFHFPDPNFESFYVPFQVFPHSTTDDLDAEFQVFSDSTSQYINPENQGLPGTSSEDIGSQQPKWF